MSYTFKFEIDDEHNEIDENKFIIKNENNDEIKDKIINFKINDTNKIVLIENNDCIE